MVLKLILMTRSVLVLSLEWSTSGAEVLRVGVMELWVSCFALWWNRLTSYITMLASVELYEKDEDRLTESAG